MEFEKKNLAPKKVEPVLKSVVGAVYVPKASAPKKERKLVWIKPSQGRAMVAEGDVEKEVTYYINRDKSARIGASGKSVDLTEWLAGKVDY